MKTLACILRRNTTDAERILWRHLRDRRLGGFKFRRQLAIEPYIVDFACLESKLIVEADGGQHTDQEKDDAARTGHLERLGYCVLRFWNHEILNDIETVLERILDGLNRPPHPIPLPKGEGEFVNDDRMSCPHHNPLSKEEGELVNDDRMSCHRPNPFSAARPAPQKSPGQPSLVARSPGKRSTGPFALPRLAPEGEGEKTANDAATGSAASQWEKTR